MTGFTKIGLVLGIPVAAILLIPLMAPTKSKLGGARSRRQRRGLRGADEDFSTLTPGEINRRLDRLDKLSSKLTREFIDAGRGYEKPSETRTKTDPLAERYKAWSREHDALHAEISRRYGPGAPSRMPTRTRKTFGGLGGVKVHGKKGKPGFSVSIDEEEISCWQRRWPDGDLDGLEHVTAEFDTNGDLVDLECNQAGGSCEKWDGSALVSLTEDMQCAGESRLGLKDRCHSDEWLHCMRD